jgi:hypothetical protein
MHNPENESMEFPSLSEIEGARHEILSRVASGCFGGDGSVRAAHNSHSSGTGKGHTSVVNNRPVADDQVS